MSDWKEKLNKMKHLFTQQPKKKAEDKRLGFVTK